jgi:integrase
MKGEVSMTGSIQTKKDRKNYYAVLNVYNEDGERKLKWVDTGVPTKGNNKRLANKRLQEILVEYGENGVDITKDVYFTDFMASWLENLKHSIAPTTYDSYQIVLNSHILPYFGKKKLRVRDMTPAVIQKYVNDKLKGLSANSVRKHLANISKCLDSAVRQNILAYNPVKRIELPKKERYTGAKHYNEKQIEQLLEISKGGPLEIVIMLTLFYGLRRSEVLGLKWDAIDFEEKTLVIRHTVVRIRKTLHKIDNTKNESSHTTFPMSEKIISDLESWREQQREWKSLQPNDYVDEGYICTKPNGELLSPEFVSKHFKLLLKKNDMPPIRFHDLRHSSASYLKALNFDLKDIQVWLRHKDIQTTMNLYTHLDLEAKTVISNRLNEKFKAFGA